MYYIKTVVLLVLITLAVLQNWLLVAGVLVLYYSFFYKLELLIILAILIDGYFGNFSSVPWLSLFSIVWYLLASYLGQRLVKMNSN